MKKWSRRFSGIIDTIHARMAQENSDFGVKSSINQFYAIKLTLNPTIESG
jgi:hypothetical protein